MAATVLIPTTLRGFTGNRSELALAGSTVAQVLDALVKECPETKTALFDGEGKLRHFGSAGPIIENVFAVDGNFLLQTKDRLLRLKLPEAN